MLDVPLQYSPATALYLRHWANDLHANLSHPRPEFLVEDHIEIRCRVTSVSQRHGHNIAVVLVDVQFDHFDAEYDFGQLQPHDRIFAEWTAVALGFTTMKQDGVEDSHHAELPRIGRCRSPGKRRAAQSKPDLIPGLAYVTQDAVLTHAHVIKERVILTSTSHVMERGHHHARRVQWHEKAGDACMLHGIRIRARQDEHPLTFVGR